MHVHGKQWYAVTLALYNNNYCKRYQNLVLDIHVHSHGCWQMETVQVHFLMTDTHTPTHLHTLTHTHTHTYTHTHTHLHTYTHTHTHTHTHTPTHSHTHIHTYTLTHTHTHLQVFYRVSDLQASTLMGIRTALSSIINTERLRTRWKQAAEDRGACARHALCSIDWFLIGRICV